MRPLVPIFCLLAAAPALQTCDRQPAAPEIDPRLGLDCFNLHRTALPPGTQYEGIDTLQGERLSIKVMNGVEVVSVACELTSQGALQPAAR